jgi:hypothetical protein
MLYREIIAVCSEIHTKHINTLCGQNVVLLNVKLAVHTVYSLFRHPVTPKATSFQITPALNFSLKISFQILCFQNPYNVAR